MSYELCYVARVAFFFCVFVLCVVCVVCAIVVIIVVEFVVMLVNVRNCEDGYVLMSECVNVYVCACADV